MKHPTKALEWAFDDDIAELIATVRREALEEAALLVEAYPTGAFDNRVGTRDLDMSEAIRALKDGAK